MSFSTKLPTMVVFLDGSGKWRPHTTRWQFEKERKPYYVAVAHYENDKNGDPQVYLESRLIKRLCYITPDADPIYGGNIAQVWSYGVAQF